mgnify:CR=1 FL=1
MKIVIDVDTDNPIHHAEGTDYFMPDLHAFISENMLKILKEGCKVLPKGHGDLIDRNDLLYWSYEIVSMYCELDEVVNVSVIKDAPTIIEADKENQNENPKN